MNARAAAAATIAALLVGPWLAGTLLLLAIIYPAWPCDPIGWALLLVIPAAWVAAEAGAKQLLMRRDDHKIMRGAVSLLVSGAMLVGVIALHPLAHPRLARHFAAVSPIKKALR